MTTIRLVARGDAMIEVEDLRKAFGKTQALAGVSLTVPTGSILGLLGPNGAGKTTLVRIVATLLVPDSGSAHVAGIDVVSDPQGARSVIGLAGQAAAVDELLASADVIKRVTLAPEIPGALVMIDRLGALGIAASGGHSDAWDEQARAGFDHGMRHVTHTFNCMSSARRRGFERVAGLLEFALGETGIACELIADGHHVSPTLMKMLYRAKGAAGICLVTDATAGAGLPDGATFLLAGRECTARGGACLLADGSALAGSAARFSDYAVGEQIDHVDGVTVEEAEHQMATRLYQNTARVHFNQLAQSKDRFGRRLIYGGHVISLARALSFNGLANAFHVTAINGGRHVAPLFAGSTVFAWSEVLAKAELPRRSDVGALRLRTIATKDQPCADFPLNQDGADHPAVVLDLDYWVLMPR